MNPVVIIMPAALVLGGVAMFVLLPVNIWVRVAILLGELAGAALVGFVLWRRFQR